MTKTFSLLSTSALAATLAVTAYATHPHGDEGHDAKPSLSERVSYGNSKSAEAKAEASKDEVVEWDVTDPSTWDGGAETVDIDIDVTEGSWMSLDVSPDGRTIAFDLLGDIYTLPVGGGRATNISAGLNWDIQPRFSPNGERIAFISDREGGDNIFTMKVDGSDAKQITKEDFRLLNNPTWSPDGRFIAGRKHFTTSRSLGTGEIWLYDADMGGAGVQLVEKPNERYQKELGEPIFAPDGTSIYYTRNTTPGDNFVYAEDSNKEVFAIYRYDMDTGEKVKVVGGPGGAVRPTPSPDGKTLVFVKRVDNQSMLHLMDLDSGDQRMVFDHLDADMQETWAVHGLYPNMDFSPDGQTLYFWAKGLIHALDVESGDVEHIDFRVKDTRMVVKAPRPTTEVSPDTFQTEMARHLAVSPDGKTTVFNALGKLYMPREGRDPVRVTKLGDDVREIYPSFSRDGREIVFVTWTDTDLAQIHTMDVRSKRITTLDLPPGHYARPTFSPDGELIVFERNSGGGLRSDLYGSDPGLYVVDREGGEPIRFAESGALPHFGADPLRIYFSSYSDGALALKSVNLLGGDARTHMSNKMAQGYFVSPDGSKVAFRENYNLYVADALPGPQSVGITKDGGPLPVTKLSDKGATYPVWMEDGHMAWTMGPHLFMADTEKMAADEDAEAQMMEGILSVEVDKAVPSGTLAITGADVVTMTDDEGGVIKNATIIIEGDRIAAIGTDIDIPRGAKRLELDGQTIIPGIIDAHAHGPKGSDEIILNTNWNTLAHLAFGVTTIFDPSSRAAEILPFKEMQRMGRVLGPRTFTTGEVIYGAKAPGFLAYINSYDDALEHVARLDEQGAIAVKNYNQPRRDQRQQVAHAARKRNLLTVAEGGSLYHMDMNLLADGNSSVEHNLPNETLYDDVVQMFAGTNVAYTMTLSVTYGGIRGVNYYYDTTDVWKHLILSKHVPPADLRADTQRRQKAPSGQYFDDRAARASKPIFDAGVPVSLGAHGEREGLGAHWEMQSFARGGYSPVEALMTGTVNPARHLGMSDDIGTLEVGKLADMVILGSDPLEDIKNSEDIEHVIQGGRVFEAGTMKEIITGDGGRGAYPWE